MSTTVIVGSGVGAVAVARRLLERDKAANVLMIEAGGDFPMQDYRKWLDFVMTRVSPTRAFEDDVSDAEINADGGFALVGGRMLARGGSTNHWGGWCPRMKPEDFHLGDVRKESINWPIDYGQLAAHYTQAEHYLHVCGDSAAASVPRNGDRYPHDPIPFTALDRLLIPTMEKLGIGYEALPLARNPAVCRTTGTCRYCPLGARYAAGLDLTSLLSDFGARVELRLRSPVLRVETSSRKMVSGVSYIDMDSGETRIAVGDRVVIAAGTIESAKILLASQNGHWPQGVGNASGHVGRHLVTHPLLRGIARIDSNDRRLEQEIDFPTLASRHFDTEQFQAQGKMFFVRDGKYVVIPIADRLVQGRTTADIDEEIVTRTRIELRGLVEAFPAEGNAVSIASGRTKNGLPRTRIQYREASETSNARREHHARLQGLLADAGLKESPPLDSSGARADHAVGTCRMSADAADGVTDRDLRVHDVDNLFVCSNAVFPNTGAVNPTLTLVALALRLGDRLSSA